MCIMWARLFTTEITGRRQVMRKATHPKTDVTPIESLVSIDGLASVLNASRRTTERLRAAGKLPKPDLHVGKLPRWKPETIRRWIEAQASTN